MQVNFSFPQILPTAYPDLEITIVFAGKAIVTGGGAVHVLRVLSPEHASAPPLRIPDGYESQNLATGQMGYFLSMCREAARKAAYKIQKAEEADADAKFEASRPNNGGFVPNPADTKYMNGED